MDANLLERHFARIGARVRIGPFVDRRPWIAREGLVQLDITQDRNGELFDVRIVPHAEPRIEVVQIEPKLRHLLLLTQDDDSAAKQKFLCGHDERHWFAAAVPGSSASTVLTAMDALKPRVVSAREASVGLHGAARNRRKNAAFRRQGEWFFIPTELRVDPKLVLRNEPLARTGGKPHWLEFAYRTGGETVMVCARYPQGLTLAAYRSLIARNAKAAKFPWQTMQRNAGVFAKGKVSHADHNTIVLHDWCRVIMNRENESAAMKHLAYVD